MAEPLPSPDPWSQEPWAVRLEWGRTGALRVAAHAGLTVVVDVLSFTTTLSVAADLGTTVLPYPAHDAGAVGYAAEHDAVLAGRRGDDGPNLSPASLRRSAPPARLVLPSPNGSTIATALAGSRSAVVGACLRNALLVGPWARALGAQAQSVAVVPAGERWPDGSLRPAAEDLWGAGAVVESLLRAGWADASPEARLAAAAYRDVAGDVRGALEACASGRELTAAGHGEDVAIAAELGAGRTVPALGPRGFVPIFPPASARL